VKATGWLRGLEVTVGGAGIVSHAGLVLLRALADKTGLTAGLSQALATDRVLVHDRCRVLADLACAIAGAEVISDLRVMGDQRELFGQAASVPTCWRALDEIASGGGRALARISAAVNSARRRAWAQIEARHGALPGVQVADKVLEGVTCLRLDASGVPCHSGKQGAEPNFKGFGLHPLGLLVRQHRPAAGRQAAARQRPVQHLRRPPGGPGRGDHHPAGPSQIATWARGGPAGASQVLLQATAAAPDQVKPTFKAKCPSLRLSTPPPAQCTMNASKMMARMATTTQKRNTTMPGMAYPATVLPLLAMAPATRRRPGYSAGV